MTKNKSKIVKQGFLKYATEANDSEWRNVIEQIVIIEINRNLKNNFIIIYPNYRKYYLL